MVHVVMATSDGLELTGGVNAFEVAADTVRRMILELDRRFPGLGEHIDQRMAMAIDGVIYQDAWSASLGPDAEVVLIPKIGGG